MRSESGTACGTKERMNAKNRSSFLYLIARLSIKIGYAQSMVVQTVKNTTIGEQKSSFSDLQNGDAGMRESGYFHGFACKPT